MLSEKYWIDNFHKAWEGRNGGGDPGAAMAGWQWASSGVRGPPRANRAEK